MTTTQLLPNNYRLRNAISFMNSFNGAANTLAASFTGALTSGNNQITSISSNTGLAPGQLLTSNVAGAVNNAVTIVSSNSTVAIMSAAANASGSATVNAYSVTTSPYYMFAGMSPVWSSVPQYYDCPAALNFSAYNSMLFGKSVLGTDVSLMINAYQWTAGTIYAMYDDQNSSLSTSEFFVYVTDNTNYYIFKCLYNNNNSASTYAPTYASTRASDTYYSTADGYQWKYMYQIPVATYRKFQMNGYIPLTPDSAVVGNAVSGSIDVIIPVNSNGTMVSSTGSGYSNYHTGNLSSSTVVNGTNPIVTLDSLSSKSNNFYNGCMLYINSGTGAGQYRTVTSHVSNTSGVFVTLNAAFTTVPDNTSQYSINPTVVIFQENSDTLSNAAAMAIISSNTGNSVSSVQILNRGANIYGAAAYVNASAQVGVSNTALLRVIIGPKGGHGANAASELYCNTVGISVYFANSESNTIPYVNDYQIAGLIANPLYSNVIFTTNNTVGSFQVGETVTQSYGNQISTGVVTVANPLQITNASATWVVSSNTSTALVSGSISGASSQITSIQINGVNKSFRTFNQLYAYNGFYNSGTFTPNELVYQNGTYLTNNSLTQANLALSSISSGLFHSNNASGTTVYLTEKLGPIYSSNTLIGLTSGAIFTINTLHGPDLVPESGDILYMENFTAVNRSNTQSETIKLLLTF